MTASSDGDSWSRFTWRAGADRVAHAVSLSLRARPRTACGLPPVLEALAGTEIRRCTDCPHCLAALGFSEDDDEGEDT